MSDTARDTLAKKTTSENVVSGGHLVAKALKNEGVDTIFTLCGGHIIDIYDDYIDEGIRIIDVRHERRAIGWTRGLWVRSAEETKNKPTKSIS